MCRRRRTRRSACGRRPRRDCGRPRRVAGACEYDVRIAVADQRGGIGLRRIVDDDDGGPVGRDESRASVCASPAGRLNVSTMAVTRGSGGGATWRAGLRERDVAFEPPVRFGFLEIGAHMRIEQPNLARIRGDRGGFRGDGFRAVAGRGAGRMGDPAALAPVAHAPAISPAIRRYGTSS